MRKVRLFQNSLVQRAVILIDLFGLLHIICWSFYPVWSVLFYWLERITAGITFLPRHTESVVLSFPVDFNPGSVQLFQKIFKVLRLFFQTRLANPAWLLLVGGLISSLKWMQCVIIMITKNLVSKVVHQISASVSSHYPDVRRSCANQMTSNVAVPVIMLQTKRKKLLV